MTNAFTKLSPRARDALFVAALCVPYVLALNPYFLPGTYDDVVYFFGARSLATEGRFLFDHKIVADWAPGLPAMLVPLFWLGIASPLSAKMVIVACVAGTLACTLHLVRRWQWPHPHLVVAVTALAPAGFLYGTRGMSEWPFFLFVMLFAWQLERVRDRATLVRALGLGALLAAASLVRWVGPLLGVALAMQGASRALRTRRVFSAWPEALAAVTGLVPFVAWRLMLARALASGEAVARYQPTGSVFKSFDPLGFLELLSDALFFTDKLLVPPVTGVKLVAFAAALVVGALVLTGAFLRTRTQLRPMDLYAVASLFLLATVPWKFARYAVPMMPWLVAWIVASVEALAARVRVPHKALVVAACAWLLVFALLDSVLLVRGSQAYGGLAWAVSRDGHAFYHGAWQELWDASQVVAARPEHGAVLIAGSGNRKYLLAFSGREAHEMPGDGHEMLAVIVGEIPPALAGRIEVLATFGETKAVRLTAPLDRRAVPRHPQNDAEP